MEEALDLSFDRLLMMMMTLCNIQEDGIAFSDYCDNLKTHNVHVALTSERTKHKKVTFFLEIRFS